MHAIVPAPGASPGPLLVLSNVSFGKVTVNGTLLSGPPPLVTTFRRGLNSLTLTAVPLRPRTCTVQWPEAQVQGVCDVRRDVRAPYHVSGRSVTPVALVELWFSGDDLPANVRERTLANISATLRAVPLRTTVPAGEYVATGLDADGQITSQRVATPLYADLVVTATSLDFIGDEFCADPGCVPRE